MLITPDQIRAARALKNWSQTELADRTGLAVPTIANIEAGKQSPGKNTLEKIVRAFESADIEFTAPEGVQKRHSSIQIYTGISGFKNFVNDVDQTVKKMDGGYISVSNVNENNFMRWVEDGLQDIHQNNILSTKVRYKIIIEENDVYMPASSYAEYRWAAKEHFYSVPLYIYGPKVAFIGFEKNNVSVFVIEQPAIVSLCQRQFDQMWERSKKITKKAGK